MLKALVSGQIGFWKVLCCWPLSFLMCAPEPGTWLSPSSYWWYIFLSLRVLYTILGWYFCFRKLWLRRKTDLWERDLENFKQTHFYCNPLDLWERKQGPQGSALNLLQLLAFSHSLLFKLPMWASILIFPSLSLLHHPLFIHLFHSLVSFSHSFWLPHSLTLISPDVSSFCWSLY